MNHDGANKGGSFTPLLMLPGMRSEVCFEGEGAGAGAGAGEGAAGTPWFADQSLGFDEATQGELKTRGFTDADPKALVPKIGKAFVDLLKVAKGKENAILLPAADDAKGMGELFGKLGRPAEAGKYELPKDWTDQQKAAFPSDKLKAYQDVAHAANMTQGQFATFIAGHAKMAATAGQHDTERYNGELKLTTEKLEREFGASYGDKVVAAGNLAMTKLGISKENVTALGEALGVEKTLRMLADIGGLLGQDAGPGKGIKSEVVLDATEAARKIQDVRMGRNKEFYDVLMNRGHPEWSKIDAQWREWQKVAGAKR